MSVKINPYTLQDKNILVTGASSGIGRQIAISSSLMGGNIIITGRNADRLQETFTLLNSDGKHTLIQADLVVQEEVEKVVNEVGILDGAVLCAGSGVTVPVKFAKRDKFQKVFDINFFSQIELIRLLFKKKKLSTNSSIVIIDSIGGTHDISIGSIVYGTSKAALMSAMKYCAQEFAQQQIRINCICPGMVETPLIHRGTITEEQLKDDMERYPLKRYGKPEEVAYMAIYLLSDASAWVTGQDFVIDGGITI